jgi:molybdopterin synthase catalytic subunit
MVRVEEDDFDLSTEVKKITDGRTDIGAVVSFTGLVRDFQNNADTPKPDQGQMTLEHYPGMTEKQLEQIEAEAHKRWPLSASLIIHRFGTLNPGDQIVLVLTASPHRQAAFEAAMFLMDWLKTKAPFWKK